MNELRKVKRIIKKANKQIKAIPKTDETMPMPLSSTSICRIKKEAYEKIQTLSKFSEFTAVIRDAHKRIKALPKGKRLPKKDPTALWLNWETKPISMYLYECTMIMSGVLYEVLEIVEYLDDEDE